MHSWQSRSLFSKRHAEFSCLVCSSKTTDATDLFNTDNMISQNRVKRTIFFFLDDV